MVRTAGQHKPSATEKPKGSVVEHPSSTDKTLAHYLDAMLHEATSRTVSDEDDVAPTTIRVPEPKAPEPKVPEPVGSTVREERIVGAPIRAEVPAPVSPVSAPHTEAEPAVEPQASPEPKPDLDIWLDNGRPAWAQERFDCLMFVVDGLRLAVPLVLLGNIHPLERDLTPLFDQPKWFLGLLSLGQERTIRVVDTAKLVMPERYRPESVDELAYAVGVHDSDWAFGCHQIEGSLTLLPEQVKWRSSRTSRPWLAGTVIDEMCALVDLHAFARTLEQGKGR
ncbi:MAG: chemotaxis protein CheW [Saccharospirillum sp.]